MQTHAEFQVTEVFPICEIFRGIFYPNLQKFVWRRPAGAHPAFGNQKNTSITEFCYEGEN